MEISTFNALLDLMVTGAGVYVIYLYIDMVKSRRLKQNMLLPKDLNLKKCSDVEGYINFMGTKQLIFGLVALLCGVIGLIEDYTHTLGMAVYLAAIGVFLITVVWYTVSMKKALKLFWGK